MPDPRMTTHRIGTEYQRRLTFKADGTDIVYDETQAGGSAVVGRAVLISGNGIVRLTGAASAVHGKLLLVEPGNWCTVLVGGPCDLPKGDGAVTVGTKIVGDVLTGATPTTRGFIRSVAAATLAEVAVADHKIIDPSVTTAVEVDLT